MKWLDVLDVDRAIANVRTDLKGDWYRDPWGWPEYDHVSAHRDILAARLNDRGLRRASKIDVAKEHFSTRPAVVLDPVDRLGYQALVDIQSKAAIGDLGHTIHGWRLPVKPKATGVYARNDFQWDAHRSHLQGLVGLYDFGLKTDVTSFFASIPVERLIDELARKCGSGRVTDRIADMLTAYDQIPDRSGLPQRSAASAVLANMYLMRLDRVLDAYSATVPGFLGQPVDAVFARWMDDIWAFGDDEAELRGLQLDLEKELRAAGLQMNIGKTDLLEGDRLAAAALQVEHSAVDEALDDEPANVQPLEELIDAIVEDPTSQDRTTIRFALTRLRKQRLASRTATLIEAAPRMPHGADHLARTFRDLGTWRDLQGWFVDYENGPWSKIEWSVAQLGTMFPTRQSDTRERISREVVDCFSRLLLARRSMPIFALTAQRLSAWAPDTCREILHDLVNRADHPFERRVIGLAALGLREERRFIRGALAEYEENSVVLKMIEDRNYRPVPESRDFSAN